jgi:NAD(P)-dependent dehydrogenase (short-subunit alcohol dehydrogenase family)
MAKIFITGSSSGLGFMTGRLLIEQGHTVVLHARNEQRADDLKAALPKASAVLIGDLSTLAGMSYVAEQGNSVGRFDAVIHNVGLGFREPPTVTPDGLRQLWAVNVLAPYVLTALLRKPDRLIYLSSAMHHSADPSLRDLQWSDRAWDSRQAYADTKFHDLLLAFYIAQHWRDVRSNALTPGWVPTRMGGASAPDDIDQAHLTQVWLAVSNDPEALETGGYFYHQRRADIHPATRRRELQESLISYCHEMSGIALPT